MRSSDRNAFTLLELLSVIAIIAVLAGLVAAVYSRVRESGRQTQCLENLRQIAQAVFKYAGDNEGRFPVFKDFDVPLAPYARDPRLFHCPSADESNRDKSRPDGLRNDYFLSGLANDFVRDADGQVHAVGKLAATQPSPASTVMCGDATGSLRTVSYVGAMPMQGIVRHLSGANCVFMDGHAKFMTPEEQLAQEEVRAQADQ
jgi:prepilin-type N-terminal cleavage/methylation domain-containing protein/prepilin-type processing-associated H-X9-DG protein